LGEGIKGLGEGEVIANDGIHIAELEHEASQAFGLSEGVRYRTQAKG
jgi:hypothetical protein